MEITGKVLREVEFRDRLRGYDTDEVDEFLEEVAVAVDELHRRLAQQTARAATSGEEVVPVQEALPSFDDDAIRRTLVLAQRTADLAIREANEEASRILDESRREAQDLVAQASENARRIRQEADEDFAQRVNLQLAQREQLERDVRMLSALVNEERTRLADSLQTVLRYVTDNLSIPADLTAAAAAPAPSIQMPIEKETSAGGAYFAPSIERGKPPVDDALPGVGPDEETLAFPPETESSAPAPSSPVNSSPSPSTASPTDPDEELWQRWAQSEELDEEDVTDDSDPFGFNRKP